MTLLCTGSLTGGYMASMISKEPQGCKGSQMHTLTNDKLDKRAYAKDMAKTQVKDTLILTATAGTAAGAAALGTKYSSKVAEFLSNTKSKIGETLSNVSVNGKDLKTAIKETKIYEKFAKLPAPAKAAASVGAAVLGAGALILNRKHCADSGYYEAKNETK